MVVFVSAPAGPPGETAARTLAQPLGSGHYQRQLEPCGGHAGDRRAAEAGESME